MKPALILLFLAFGASAADYHLELAPETTKINWTLGDVLHTVHGTFRLKRGDIHFDPDHGQAGGEVVVDATSGQSGSRPRDARMHKSILESAKYPEVSFVPDRLEGRFDPAGTSSVKLHGIFKIHGGAHEITVPVEVAARDNQLVTTIKFEVPYVAWGMKDPSTFILKCDKSVVIEMQTTSPWR